MNYHVKDKPEATKQTPELGKLQKLAQHFI